jgi:hypothetical protein
MNKGIIYLIQPTELIGTNRYKIGCSKTPDLDRCKNGYKKGSRYLSIMECINPLELEKIIKKTFNNKFKLIAGNEYYEGNEKEILEIFIDLVIKYYKNDSEINNNEENNSEENNNEENNSDNNDDILECKKFFPNYYEDISFNGNKILIKINIYENNDFEIILKINYICDDKKVDEIIIDMNKKDETKCYYYLQKLEKNNIIENNKIYDLNNNKFIKNLLKYKHHNKITLLPETIIEVNNLFYEFQSTSVIIKNYFNTDTIINDNLYVSMSISNNFFIIYNTPKLFAKNNFYIVKINDMLYDLQYIKKYVPYNIRSNDEYYYMLNRDYEYIGINTKSVDFKFNYNEYVYGDKNTCYNIININNNGFKNIIKKFTEIAKNKICLNPNDETNKLMTLY